MKGRKMTKIKQKKELDEVIEEIKKKTKDPNAIMRLGDSKNKMKNIDVISFVNPPLPGTSSS